MSGSTHGVNIRTFLYPGILAMSLLFTALFSAAPIVWDREFGFLREMLVAPVRRGSIVIGKCLGGATVAAAQGVVVIAVAGLVGVPYDPVMIIEVFLLQLLLAFALTVLGLSFAVRVKQVQGFMAINQMLVMPLFFTSGALFPVTGLPGWLAVLNRLDLLTYAIDPIRHVVFARLDISPAARRVLDLGVTWGNWVVPPLLEVAIVAATGLALLGVAIVRFSKTE
jgi:ABC-2 type transport system permease protein